MQSVKALKANQKYTKVVEQLKKTEEKLLVLREKKRQLATNIHDTFHEPNVNITAGN